MLLGCKKCETTTNGLEIRVLKLNDTDLRRLKINDKEVAYQYLRDQGVSHIFKHLLSEGQMPDSEKLKAIQQDVMKESAEIAQGYEKQREEIEKIRMQSRGIER